METAARKYLGRHLEQNEGTNDEKRSLMEKLKIPLSSETIQYGESGMVRCEKESFRLEFSYRKPSVEENENYFGDEALRELVGERAVKMAAESYWIVDNMRLTNVENNFSTSITDDLPPDFLIVYRPLDQKIKHRIRTDAPGKYKYIEIFDDLTKPYALVALLHELGHAVDYESRTDNEKKEFNHEKDDPEGLASLLVKERNAWAYAVRKFKKFLNNDFLTKADLLKLAHEIMLLQYSHGIRLKLMEIDNTGNADQVKKITDELDQEQRYILGVE